MNKLIQNVLTKISDKLKDANEIEVYFLNTKHGRDEVIHYTRLDVLETELVKKALKEEL